MKEHYYYISRELIKQMEPNFSCARTRNVSMVVWDSSPPEKGAPIQIKQIFLNILRTNQANGTKIGMWEFLKARNVSMVV